MGWNVELLDNLHHVQGYCPSDLGDILLQTCCRVRQSNEFAGCVASHFCVPVSVVVVRVCFTEHEMWVVLPFPFFSSLPQQNVWKSSRTVAIT